MVTSFGNSFVITHIGGKTEFFLFSFFLRNGNTLEKSNMFAAVTSPHQSVLVLVS